MAMSPIRIRYLAEKFKSLDISGRRAKGLISKEVKKAFYQYPNLPEKVKVKIERQINREGWMERILEARFDAERTHVPGGSRWARLSPRYARTKRGPSILWETGRMRSQALRAVRGSFRVDGVVWEDLLSAISVEYARYHMEGTPRMPARRFLENPSSRELRATVARAKELAKIEFEALKR